MKLLYANPGITDDQLNAILRKWKMDIPDSYRKLILEYNGGIPEKRYFRGGKINFIPFIYGDTSIEFYLQLYSDPEDGAELLDLFPFCESNGTIYAFSARGNDLGAVYWLDEDWEKEFVCGSFDEFVAELSDSSDY